MQELLGVKILYHDGDYSYSRFNGSPEEAEEYYIGTSFNFGWFNGKELFKTCVSIETFK